MLNYHELTMEESRTSPARRKQFVIICTIMAMAFVYSVLSAGALEPINIYEGVFPEGDFVYKFAKRDYAASMSLVHAVAKDLSLKPKEYEDTMYSVFLDDPNKVFGRQQRFACGVLIRPTAKEEEDDETKRYLLELNKQNDRKLTRKEIKELAAHDLWPKLKYESKELPAARVVMTQFPFTDGFVSALLHSYRIYPKLRQHAMAIMKTDVVPSVITTCSIKESMCTHFVPIEDTDRFLLGHIDTKSYLDKQTKSGMVDWDGVYSLFLKIVTLGQVSKNAAPENGKDEL